jgi:tetrahydromethanopterin S-methyltransferase subunit G
MATPAPKKAEPSAASDADELKALRARLEELEKRAAK